MRRLIAAVVFTIGVAACVIAGIVVGSDAPDSEPEGGAEVEPTESFEIEIDAAMSDNEANDRLADSAPQQQVVNGWVARDLLRTMAQQNEAQADTLDAIAEMQAASPPPDDRPARLLVILTALVGWIGLWAAVPRLLRPTSDDAMPKSDQDLEAPIYSSVTLPPPPTLSDGA